MNPRLIPLLVVSAGLIAVEDPPVINSMPPIAARFHVDAFGYVDDGEFSSPWRDGETILVGAARGFVEWDLAPAKLALGATVVHRNGSAEPAERLRPVIRLRFGNAEHAFTIGTIDTVAFDLHARPGPDRLTPHGLVPVLQREDLAVRRPHEDGVQWRIQRTGLRHDLWLHWQRVNTASDRERFDVGENLDVALLGPLRLIAQGHAVHEGGQQHGDGVVGDSFAGGLGPAIALGGSDSWWLAAETLRLWSLDRPDRSRAELTRSGIGWWNRVEGGFGALRLHLIRWSADDVNHDEGDPLYLAARADGSSRGGGRSLTELGAAWRWKPRPDVVLDPSLRWHQADGEGGFSVRVMARIGLDAATW